MQGRLFLSARIVGFYASIFGNKTKFFFLWEDIEEIHEPLWSMDGVRNDLRLLLDMLAQKFKRKPRPATSHYDDDISGRLDIREIYRRLLREGARSGVVRRSHETTYEYGGRLGQYVPDGREQLNSITDLYVDVRYGDVQPEEEQVDKANSLWRTLRDLIRGPGDAV